MILSPEVLLHLQKKAVKRAFEGCKDTSSGAKGFCSNAVHLSSTTSSNHQHKILPVTALIQYWPRVEELLELCHLSNYVAFRRYIHYLVISKQVGDFSFLVLVFTFAVPSKLYLGSSFRVFLSMIDASMATM